MIRIATVKDSIGRATGIKYLLSKRTFSYRMQLREYALTFDSLSLAYQVIIVIGIGRVEGDYMTNPFFWHILTCNLSYEMYVA